MTEGQILILGARISIRTHCGYEEMYTDRLSQLFDNHALATESNGPKLLHLQRAYDSDDMEDHPIYLAWAMFDFPKEGLLSPEQIAKLTQLLASAQKAKMAAPPEVEDFLASVSVNAADLVFGLYTDYYDSDRGYEIYDLERETHDD